LLDTNKIDRAAQPFSIAISNITTMLYSTTSVMYSSMTNSKSVEMNKAAMGWVDAAATASAKDAANGSHLTVLSDDEKAYWKLLVLANVCKLVRNQYLEMLDDDNCKDGDAIRHGECINLVTNIMAAIYKLTTDYDTMILCNKYPKLGHSDARVVERHYTVDVALAYSLCLGGYTIKGGIHYVNPLIVLYNIYRDAVCDIMEKTYNTTMTLTRVSNEDGVRYRCGGSSGGVNRASYGGS
jgi:hypothetical protein